MRRAGQLLGSLGITEERREKTKVGARTRASHHTPPLSLCSAAHSPAASRPAAVPGGCSLRAARRPSPARRPHRAPWFADTRARRSGQTTWPRGKSTGGPVPSASLLKRWSAAVWDGEVRVK